MKENKYDKSRPKIGDIVGFNSQEEIRAHKDIDIWLQRAERFIMEDMGG